MDKTKNNMIFTHFGTNLFNPEEFQEITNETYCGGLKPKGGIWGSFEEGLGWKKWCEINEYEFLNGFNLFFRFKLTDNAHILYVLKDELDIFKIEGTLQSYDWLKIKEKYDAVYIPAGTNQELYMKYYGWDCDSIIVLNKNVVIQM